MFTGGTDLPLLPALPYMSWASSKSSGCNSVCSFFVGSPRDVSRELLLSGHPGIFDILGGCFTVGPCSSTVLESALKNSEAFDAF